MEIKTLGGWHTFAEKNEKGDWDCYAHPGDLVDEEVYDYFLDVLPPRSMGRGYLQVGEPHSHRMNPATGKVQATYATFQKVQKGVWMYMGNCFPGQTWEPDALRFTRIRDFLKKTYRMKNWTICVRPHIICKDGFNISVQAGAAWYCNPRENLESGEYEAVEVGGLNREEELLTPYAENPRKLKGTVYGYVPVSVVEAVIAKHGGAHE